MMLKSKSFHTISICLLAGILFQHSASAAVPIAGWGYSFGNWLSGQSDNPDDFTVITEGWGWVLDPPANNPIISGRITLKFDPSWTVGGYGWLGEFGADPNLPAPPIGAIRFDSSLLQINANPAMQSSNITIDQSNGLAVFEFDWGTSGFIPTKNLNDSGHFNFAAILFTNPLVLPDDDLVTAIGAGSIAPYGVVGSPQETALLGTNSPTYMLCQGGYCGERKPVPEPFTILGSLSALSFGAYFKRQLKSSKSSQKATAKVR